MKHPANGYRELRVSRDEALRMYQAERDANRDAALRLAKACRERDQAETALFRVALAATLVVAVLAVLLARLAWRAQG